MTIINMIIMQMSSDRQYKPLQDEISDPSDVAATQDDDAKKGCTRYVRAPASIK